jgi:aminopeptidase N
LFHQWFGDLVTLESWANLPLNESFANYAEYLWDEHRHGRDDADLGGLKEKYQYLYEAATKREPLIRYRHNKPDDMFDSHSYAKGGRVLHLLRQELGDQAFFEGLSHYLKKYEYKTVEIHNLRLAFEEVSGRDLNWFFDQWFLKAGHPEIRTEQISEQNRLILIAHQEQDTIYSPLYRIDLPVEIKSGGKIRREKFQIRSLHDTLILPLTDKPEMVLWDADATLPGSLEQNRDQEALSAQFMHSTRGIHRLQALEELQTRGMSDQTGMAKLLRSALQDSFWACRETALEMLQDLDSLKRQESAADVLPLLNDAKPQVRKQALKFLASVQVSERRSILDKAITDSSLIVSTEALRQFLAREYPGTEDIRKKFETDTMNNYKGVLAGFYEAKEGQASFDWFIQSLQSSAGSDAYEIIRSFGQFLMKENDKSRLQQGTDFLFKLGLEGSRPEQVIGVYQVIRKMTFMSDYREKLKSIREKHKNDDFYEILEYLD